MEEFLKFWFAGFQEAIGELKETDRNRIFAACGKACSESYSRQRFLEARRNSENEQELLERLREAFPELSITVLEEGHKYQIIYRFCACDLVRQELVNTPLLCECSRRSLLYNWEAISAPRDVQVELLQSILGGAPYCEFTVAIS